MRGPPDPKHRRGERIADRYELRRFVAAGGQGSVYEAIDRQYGDTVAIKILHAEYSADANWRERLMREARALTVLHDTAAVRVLDQRWSQAGELCLVMEWLDGVSLEERLRVADESGIRIDPKDLVPLLSPIIETLEVAHVNNILHRDLKPDNIFVLNDGGIRLIDFGFAKFQRLKSMTANDQVAGSPTYLAPEVWLSGSRHVTHKIDVYALGVLVFRALTGRPPFEGTALELLRKVPHDPRPSLHQLRPDLPAELDAWVEGALAIDPAQRFESPTALWHAFQIAAGLKAA